MTDSDHAHYASHLNLSECESDVECEAHVHSDSTVILAFLKEAFYSEEGTITLNIDWVDEDTINEIHQDIDAYSHVLELLYLNPVK